MDVHELRCPNCFAPIPPGTDLRSTCRYCGTTLALTSRAAASPGSTAHVAGALILEDGGPQKISVIRVIREHTGLGLKEAKDLVEATPCLVAEWSDPARMLAFARELLGAGARIGGPYASLARAR
jgi:hypothetical protein